MSENGEVNTKDPNLTKPDQTGKMEAGSGADTKDPSPHVPDVPKASPTPTPQK